MLATQIGPMEEGLHMKRMMTTVALMMTIVGLAACDSSGGGSAGSSTTTSASGGGSAAGGSIGVKECDDYIKKFNDCYKDPTAKAAAQAGLDAMKQGWAGMAKDPQQKAALAGACKTALDNFPSAACK
jgi:hypothetical protein